MRQKAGEKNYNVGEKTKGKRHEFHEFPRTKGAEDKALMKRDKIEY